MSKKPYTYCLIKYMHDPQVGEMLNIGVLLCSPAGEFVGVRLNRHYERLSKTFAGFDGEHYRGIAEAIEKAVQKLQPRRDVSELFVLNERAKTVEDVIRFISPDRGMSIQFGPMLAGLAESAEPELEHIFEQSVLAQYPQKVKTGRDDEQVWYHYKRSLHEKRIDTYLESKTFTSESYEYRFDHAFKNENWHVLKPVTMDYATSQTIQDRATRIFGEASALDGNVEIGTYYILLGEPQLEGHKPAYTKAKNLLNKIPIKKEIIEEDAADDFAAELADYMEEHGVMG
ncbi:MAG: DUF3037 domain-containing protein [Pyrinomonadaceae bacterium]